MVQVERLKAKFDLEVDWQPFLLRPQTPPEGLPLPPEIREKVKDPNHPLKLRAKAAGLTMRLDRELIPSTRRAHEGAEFARDRGALDAFSASVLRRYWAEGEDLWQLATLRGAAVDAGLDPDELQRALEEGTWRPKVEAALAEARDLGISAVPTFLVGDRYVISGAQELLVFEQAMQRLGAKPRIPSGNA